MLDEVNSIRPTGILTYDSERDCLTLNGHELQRGEHIEIHIFDSWLPGELATDSRGWYLITFDRTGIRLQTGLLARLSNASASLQAAQSTKSRILIVDDDPALLRALSGTIAMRIPEATVDTSLSAPQALMLIQEHMYDAIVSDIKMPTMNGLELLAKIRTLQPEIPTLLITGHGEHQLAIQALRGGAYDYIQKPIERDSFIAALLRAIQTRQLRRQVADQQRKLELHARSLERLVQQRTQELVEAHAAKDKVISLVSQELNGPIERLKHITQILRKKVDTIDAAEIVHYSFDEIEQSLIQTDALLQTLQNTSHIESHLFILHRQTCDLVSLCHHVLTKITADVDVTFSWQSTEEPLCTEVDCDQISQVLRILLPMPQAQAQYDSPTKVVLQRAKHLAIIAIRNPASHSYQKADLYICRKILEQHKGHLELQSFPENRRTIFITLPLLNDEQESDSAHSYPETYATGTISYGNEIECPTRNTELKK